MKSVIVLSMHKAGTTVANMVFDRVLARKGYQSDWLARRVRGTTQKLNEYMASPELKLPREGHYFGVLRDAKAVQSSHVSDLRAIVLVRDPRDCLTSHYFSAKQSHALPKGTEKRAAMLKQREIVRERDIDTHALLLGRNYAERLDAIYQQLESHQDYLLVKYEDMVCNTERWLDQVSGFLDQPIDDTLRAELNGLMNFDVKTEAPGQHKRQVKPGDHKRKLRPQTISRLNETLGVSMGRFGYST